MIRHFQRDDDLTGDQRAEVLDLADTLKADRLGRGEPIELLVEARGGS